MQLLPTSLLLLDSDSDLLIVLGVSAVDTGTGLLTVQCVDLEKSFEYGI